MKKVLIVTLLIIIVIFGIYGVSIYRENQKPNEPIFTENGRLSFTDINTGNVLENIKIEIADTEEKQTTGLMWRKSMKEDEGMLFIFSKEEPLSFWMKNTYIPLDMIFVDKSYSVVSVQKNTTPLSEKNIFSGASSQYVIEVNAGFCDKYNIKFGDKISFERN